MSSPQSDDEILNCDPEGCDPSSNLSEKTTETGVPRGPEVRDASASDATVAEVDTENRIELTRIATELYNVDLGDPVLDPNSPDFDVYRWAKTVVRVADEAGVKFRRASFAFKDLRVSGSRVTARFQTNAASSLVAPLRLQEHVYSESRSEKAILRGLDGVTKSVEILLVLGRSGSGCSTFLKTVSGDLHGLKVDKDSELHYNGSATMTGNPHAPLANWQQGIPQEEMICQYKGEIIYNSEIDRHFPHLTVRETLEFAAAVRTPQNRLLDVSRKQHGKRTTAIAMAICGLAHAQNTKRVSIAEMMLAASSIGCWDNSTHGLDSATALEFVRSLRMFADIIGTTHAVALYQASRALYEVFDKVIVLYEGREVYFGRTEDAKSYFEEMGWCCQPRQTTADFLTSVTNHEERRPRHGFENLVPRTSKEFQHYWKTSQDYKTLLAEIRNYERELSNHTAADAFKASRRAAQSRHLRATSPYLVSIPLQIKACTTRAYQLLWNDKASTLAVVLGQVIMALIIGSIFYGTSDNTDSFFAKGSTLFFATLLNALVAVTEINSLYLQRQVVEKQASYAFCHPFAEALAGVISDAPVKLVIATCFNLILYFMAGLRSEPAQFFAFFLFTSLADYVQQQDAHLETSTVREALRFSAMLRQPKSVSKGEKYDHVEDVIEVLDMTDSSEAVVGVPGEGLNGLQRKLLSIGVELAAKPTLLIFLDEPTSGLDSQSAQAITAVLRKLANCGQAILATIHQPSSVLFLEFDRPLFLAKGGRTIYFGDIGPNAVIVLDYFKRHGARPCDQSENPAEYMLGIVTAGNSCGSEQDWPELWIESDELAFVKAEQERIHREIREGPSKVYSWVAFLLANIMVEVLYQLFLGILVYA
ncbi:hypothetical protein N0V91_011114, partial [Didymella pomorum]